MKNRLLKRSTIIIDDEWRAGIALCILAFGLFARNAFYEMTILSVNAKEYIAITVKAFILVSLLIAIPVIIRRLTNNIIIMLLGITIIVPLHMLAFPQNNIYFKETVFGFVSTILPGVLCAASIRNANLLYERLIKTSVIISIVNIMCLFVYLSWGIGNSESMGLSNALIIPVNTLVSVVVRRQSRGKLLYITLIILDLLTIIMYGSRGALLSTVVFMSLYFFCNKSEITNKRLKAFIGFAFIFVVTFLFANQILNFLINFLKSHGYSSRALVLLSNGTFFSNNGRFMIWNVIFDEIRNHPFYIRGINTDRLLRTGFYNNSNSAHNIVLEMMYSFGVPIGIAVCIFFTRLIVKTCRKLKSDEDIIRLIYMCGFFPICLFSGSIWDSISWWIWIAFCNKRFSEHLNN